MIDKKLKLLKLAKSARLQPFCLSSYIKALGEGKILSSALQAGLRAKDADERMRFAMVGIGNWIEERKKERVAELRELGILVDDLSDDSGFFINIKTEGFDQAKKEYESLSFWQKLKRKFVS